MLLMHGADKKCDFCKSPAASSTERTAYETANSQKSSSSSLLSYPCPLTHTASFRRHYWTFLSGLCGYAILASRSDPYPYCCTRTRPAPMIHYPYPYP